MARDRQPAPLTRAEGERRTLAPWVAACAERVLPVFEAAAPDDLRPRAAIEGIRAFGRGELRVGPARALAVAAHAAARSVRDPAASAAARSAGHACATAHMAAHARGVPAYASMAAGEAEMAWAIANLPDGARDVLRRLPAPPAAGGALGGLVRRLHEAAIADR
jgi:hypothetical protein